MKKSLVGLLSCTLVLLTACTQSAGSEIELKEENRRLTEEVNELKKSVGELNGKIDQFEQEKEKFVYFSNLSRDFVYAHKTGDREALRQLLSDNLVLEERDGKLYVEVEGVEWLLFDYTEKGSLDDWVLQGFEFNSETNTYSVFIREFYSDANGEPVSPPTFLNLVFEHQNDVWKIVSLGFDV
ncbi:hypothetical protein [Mesobacillus subterraneus]|uniref:Uncharacterized protein n=1 Tax=Mesobacillus subterraneus TaxID=285983 RepID=A0A3R9FHZ0_9BACI|nr:hypothetical protein [Mesobacillus subterraneus]RSD28444.1 hypothetical protein EJA10_04990 [Mesobacillus subterraneus]